MTQFIRKTAALACDAGTDMPSVTALDTCVVWFAPATLALTFICKGNVAHLRIPSPQRPRRADGLWQHTCFEVFIGKDDSPGYFEFNFSPSGEWAAYGFRGYRDGGSIEDDNLDPRIVVRSSAEALELEAVIRLDRLPAMRPGTKLRLGLSAVIEDNDGRLSHWALKHPPGKPDFHHPDSFAFELSLPGQRA
jgi:hypothetical protein